MSRRSSNRGDDLELRDVIVPTQISQRSISSVTVE